MITAAVFGMFVAIPGKPTVRVKETSPNMVILEVEPPRNNGGKAVIGYRVVFDRKMTDYAVGSLTVTIVFYTRWRRKTQQLY